MQANEEKLRLEAKQREERTIVEDAGKPWQPRWFYQVGLKDTYRGGVSARMMCQFSMQVVAFGRICTIRVRLTNSIVETQVIEVPK